ncbi:MAG TPA: tetratricopeptide repeat protein [Limnochordales bacterium]|nr:tetratricopeptide repeat protein [Limnochordales bacterium]
MSQLVREGCRLLELSRLAGAQRKFQQALRLCATSVAARSHLAFTYLLQEKHEQAAAEAEAALRFDPDHVLALTTLARAQAEGGREPEAKEAARRALRAFYARWRAGEAQRAEVAWVAAALAAVEDDQRLYQLYRWCVRGAAGPWDAMALTWLGVAAFNQGRYREARWLWRSAMGQRPALDDVLKAYLFVVDAIETERVPPFALDYRLQLESPPPKAEEPPGYVRAVALRTLWQGEDDRAREAALDLLSQLQDPWVSGFLFQIVRDPDLPDPLKMKAGAWLVERGFLAEDEPLEMHVDGALQEVLIRPRGGAKLPRDAAYWFERALEARERGDDAAAEDNYRKVLDAAPDFVPALVNLADICRQSNRCGEAEKLLARAYREDPGDPIILLHVAVLRAQQEAFAEAGAILQQLNPAQLPRELRSSYYGLAGHVALQLERPAAALDAFRRGLSEDPGNEQLYAGLVAARLLAGDRGLAAGAARRARRRPREIDPALSWADALQRLTVPQLVGLARRLGVRGAHHMRKAQLADAILEALRRRLRWVWQQLDGGERAALEWMAERGGVVALAELEERLRDGDAGPGAGGQPTSRASRLEGWGLVFAGRLPGKADPVAVLPGEVRQRLKDLARHP